MLMNSHSGGAAILTVTCFKFTATPIPGGQIRLEIQAATPDAAEDRMTFKQVAELLGKSTKQVDKLTRRQKNPLPVVRGTGMHPYFFRSKINEWLLGPTRTNNSAASVQSLFSAR